MLKIWKLVPLAKNRLLIYLLQNDDIADRPSYQALAVDPLQSEESSESKQESIAAAPMSQQKEQNAAPQNSVPIQSQFDSQSTPIQIKLPLQLDLDDIASVSIIPSCTPIPITYILSLQAYTAIECWPGYQ